MAYEKFITPAGVAIYPRLTQPDTKFNEAGVYSVKLSVDPDESIKTVAGEDLGPIAEVLDAKFVEAEKLAKKAGKKGSKLKPATAPYEAEEDDEGRETGRIILNCSMKASGVNKTTKKAWERKPVLVDARGEIFEPGAVWGGSILKLRVALNVYDSQFGYGVKLLLDGVQVLKLVQGDAASGFGNEAGDDEPAPEHQDDGDTEHNDDDEF